MIDDMGILQQMKRKMTTDAHMTYLLTGESPSNVVMQIKEEQAECATSPSRHAGIAAMSEFEVREIL